MGASFVSVLLDKARFILSIVKPRQTRDRADPTRVRCAGRLAENGFITRVEGSASGYDEAQCFIVHSRREQQPLTRPGSPS